MAFKKDSKDIVKPMFHLYNPNFHLEQVEVLTYGAKKYGLYNWQKAKQNELYHYEDALLRHMNKIQRGFYWDEDTTNSHYAHLAVNAMFLYSFLEKGWFVKR